jgi:hypothetical protein
MPVEMSAADLKFLALTSETRARRLALRERKMAEAKARFWATVDSGEWEAACRAAAPRPVQLTALPPGVDEPPGRVVKRREHEGMA